VLVGGGGGWRDREGKEGEEGKGVLEPLTGLTGGKEYMMIVKAVQRRRTQLEKRPRGPIQKGPWAMLSRPLIKRQTTGMA
jgi:hypothetical protein